jgi:hypothetical protein
MMRCAFVVLLLSCCSAALADDCTRTDAQIAGTVTDYLDSWKNVAIAFKEFAKCDDGEVAEGFSDKISRLLADHWQRLPELVQLAAKSPGLEAFVVKHLDETINLVDAQKISKLARHSCPSVARSLCTKIKARLGDVENVHPSDAT